MHKNGWSEYFHLLLVSSLNTGSKKLSDVTKTEEHHLFPLLTCWKEEINLFVRNKSVVVGGMVIIKFCGMKF